MKQFFKSLPQHPQKVTARLVKLYLEINDTCIAATYELAGQPHSSEPVWSVITLPERTIIKGIIFKPTALSSALTSYLSDQKLTLPMTTVSFPVLASITTPFRQFMLLALVLALKKVPLSLSKVVVSPLTTTHPGKNPPVIGLETGRSLPTNLPNLDELPDELTFLRSPQGKSPMFWVTGSIFLFSILLTTLTSVNWYTTRQLFEQERQVGNLRNIIINQQKKIQELSTLTQKTAELQAIVAQATKVKATTNNPTALLTTLSHQLPKNIWLNSIKIEPAAKDKQTTGIQPAPFAQKDKKKAGRTLNAGRTVSTSRPPMTVIIEGVGQSPTSILGFVQTLSTPTSGIANPTLTTLARTKTNKKQKKGLKQYQFTISGNLVTL